MTRRVWVLPTSWPSESPGEDGRTARDPIAPVAEVAPRRRRPRLKARAKKLDAKTSTQYVPSPPPETAHENE
jgi:hypothetical protein